MSFEGLSTAQAGKAAGKFKRPHLLELKLKMTLTYSRKGKKTQVIVANYRLFS